MDVRPIIKANTKVRRRSVTYLAKKLTHIDRRKRPGVSRPILSRGDANFENTFSDVIYETDDSCLIPLPHHGLD